MPLSIPRGNAAPLCSMKIYEIPHVGYTRTRGLNPGLIGGGIRVGLDECFMWSWFWILVGTRMLDKIELGWAQLGLTRVGPTRLSRIGLIRVLLVTSGCSNGFNRAFFPTIEAWWAIVYPKLAPEATHIMGWRLGCLRWALDYQQHA